MANPHVHVNAKEAGSSHIYSNAKYHIVVELWHYKLTWPIQAVTMLYLAFLIIDFEHDLDFDHHGMRHTVQQQCICVKFHEGILVMMKLRLKLRQENDMDTQNY